MTRRRTNPAVLAGYVLVSCLWFGLRLLPHPGRAFVGLGRDPEIFVWSLGWWPHALGQLDNPFVSHAIWAPDGVDLAWTTSIPALALPLAPVTLLAGPVVAYNVVAVLLPALAAWTAFLLCRHVTDALWPSVVGGYVFGFSGYLLGQELGHVHMTAVFLVPLVALAVLRFVAGELDGRGLAWRLGLLIAVQLGLSTEVAFTVTVALVVAVGLAWWLVPDVRLRLRVLPRPVAAGYALGGALASPLLVYVVTGWEAGSINRPRDFSADLLNFLVPTRLVAAGAVWAPGIAERFPGGDAERGAYLGVPVVAVLIWFAVRRWRRPATRFLVATAGLTAFAMLGTALYVGGHRVMTLPWRAVAALPGFDNVLPVRLGLFLTLIAAVVVALVLRDLQGLAPTAVGALVVLSLVPRLELPLWSTTPPRPAFFADGLYRQCVRPGENLLVIPYGADGDSMLWQAEADFDFRMAGGYILPSPPREFQRFAAVSLLHFNHLVPSTADLRTFVRAKHVDRIVVADGSDPAWPTVLAPFGPPTRLGGATVYPACGAI